MDDVRIGVLLAAVLLLTPTGFTQESTSAPATVDAPATSQPVTPEIIQGPAGSGLASIARAPDFSSPLADFLGFASTTSSTAAASRYFRSSQRRRVVKTPEMFGDFRRFPTFLHLNEGGVFGVDTLQGTIPQSGGISGLKIAENNQAIPANRAWFSFNHMHNALRTDDIDGPGIIDSTQYSADRFMIGFERTFDEGRWSLEFRMPFAGQVNEANIQSGSTGDLSLIFKRLLVADQDHARSFGVGFELPTGSDGTLTVNGISLTQESNAVHIVPFYSETRRFGSRWFAHYFAQFDLPTSDDDLILRNGLVTLQSSSRAAFTSSNDLGLGYWFLPPTYNGDSGLAAIIEGHYTSRIGDADEVDFGVLSNVNRFDSIDNVLNITLGLHAELNGSWAIRIAESFPILNDQLFDSEAIFQVLRTY